MRSGRGGWEQPDTRRLPLRIAVAGAYPRQLCSPQTACGQPPCCRHLARGALAMADNSVIGRVVEDADTMGKRVRRLLSTLGALDGASHACRAAQTALQRPASLAEEPEDAFLVRLTDMKLALASAAYDLLDAHTTRVDAALSVVSAELASRRASSSPRGDRVSAPDGGAWEARAAAPGSPGPGHLDLGVDPAEPTYCLCGQVAFGEMLMCSNSLCPREWFHLPCVGVHPGNKPSGNWVCPLCLANAEHEAQARVARAAALRAARVRREGSPPRAGSGSSDAAKPAPRARKRPGAEPGQTAAAAKRSRRGSLRGSGGSGSRVALGVASDDGSVASEGSSPSDSEDEAWDSDQSSPSAGADASSGGARSSPGSASLEASSPDGGSSEVRDAASSDQDDDDDDSAADAAESSDGSGSSSDARDTSSSDDESTAPRRLGEGGSGLPLRREIAGIVLSRDASRGQEGPRRGRGRGRGRGRAAAARTGRAAVQRTRKGGSRGSGGKGTGRGRGSPRARSRGRGKRPTGAS